MVIDPSSDIGKVRLRIGDWRDPVYLQDNVIQAAITENNGNIVSSARVCAQYILAILTFSSHEKLAQLEVWGGEQFKNYLIFLKETVNNPSFMDSSILPYVPENIVTHPMIEFVNNWNSSYGSTVTSSNITYF